MLDDCWSHLWLVQNAVKCCFRDLCVRLREIVSKMSSLRCGFGFTVLSEEEELEFEQAAIATVKQSSENCENLVTSRLRVHNKSSAAFLKGCSVARWFGWPRFLAGFLPPNRQENHLCSHFFTLFCLFISYRLETDKTVQNLVQRVQKLWVQEIGKVILGTRMKVRDFPCFL